MDLKKVIFNIPGVFGMQNVKPLPTPLGIEIENEGGDIVYLSSELDKWSMYGDRLRIINDLNVSINEAKYEQTRNAN